MLTFAAGCVDIVGYLALYHTFTAHMTGVTVHIGQSVIEGDWSKLWKSSAVLLSFICGSILGRVVIEISARSNIQRSATPPLALEAMLIGAVAVLGTKWHDSMTYVLAAAMGLQTAVLTRVGSLTVHTTFVTGMLNKLAQLLSNAAFLIADQYRGRNLDLGERRKVLRQAYFMLSIWCLYLFGAVAGAWMNAKWSLPCLFVPVFLILVVLVTDCVRPLSIQQEHDFPES